MENMDKLKKALCKELDEYADMKSLSAQDVEMVQKLTSAVKNIGKIKELDESGGYSQRMYYAPRGYSMDGSSYYGDDRYSERRDRMGRYARDGEGGGQGGSYRGGYSRHDAKEMLMNKLGEMMTNSNPEERELLKKCMRDIEES